MLFTNFTIRAGGANTNSGTLTGDTTEMGTAATTTYASGTWVQGTGVFTVASGNPVTDGIAVGYIGSIYADGAGSWAALGRVTARDATTITFTVIAGTFPTDGTNNRTVKFGGAWLLNPSNYVGTLVSGSTVNASGHLPRINYKNDIAAISATIVYNQNGPVYHEGYTNSFGDGTLGVITGSAAGAAYIPISLSGTDHSFRNMEITKNGATSTQPGLSVTGARARINNVKVHNVRGFGISCTQATAVIENCETYACNESGTANQGGMQCTAGVWNRCISRDNVAANSSGFYNSATTHAQLINCIATRNTDGGFKLGTASVGSFVNKCDFYNNTGAGINIAITAAAAMLTIENCNFFKNSTYAIELTGSLTNTRIRARNNAYGQGTQVNTSGNIQNTLLAVSEEGAISYTTNTHPWNDPDNSDFRIKNAESIGVGYGNFMSGNNTVSYPDVGSCESSKPVIPTADKVLLAEVYSYALNQLTGTDRRATVDKVLLAYAYGPSDTLIGTSRLPAVGKVEDGYLYGPSDSLEGTLVPTTIGGNIIRRSRPMGDRPFVQEIEVSVSSNLDDCELIPKKAWSRGNVVRIPTGVTTLTFYSLENEDAVPSIMHTANADGTQRESVMTVTEGANAYELPLEIESIAYLKIKANIPATLILNTF